MRTVRAARRVVLAVPLPLMCLDTGAAPRLPTTVPATGIALLNFLFDVRHGPRSALAVAAVTARQAVPSFQADRLLVSRDLGRP
ncbi:hypothetical protein [Pseudorhodoferax sp. Leaf274]|uniref:hypothetical protein n=1 Tax=Pseudorhodoferax sp. Leaf274 TaxID=1736318 RepID=UPI000702FB3B|nr:hypothetical protein [Pseudorhodoferax sp. Leaf274]KQP39791.1 hypothetical protein ASF44_08680 [Pseudorhodoferax sp. Leaf274]